MKTPVYDGEGLKISPSFFPHDAIEVQSGKKRNEKSVRTLSTWCPGHSRQTKLSKSTKREMLLVTRWEQKSGPFVQLHSVIRKFHEKLWNLGGLVLDCLVSEVVWSNILNQRRIAMRVSNVQQYDLSWNRLAHHCGKYPWLGQCGEMTYTLSMQNNPSETKGLKISALLFCLLARVLAGEFACLVVSIRHAFTILWSCPEIRAMTRPQ